MSESQAVESQAVDTRVPRSHWIILILILALGAFLRFYGLAHQPIWLDEALTIHVAKMDPAEMIDWLKIDVHPPLFYFLLHGWMKLFGSGEAAVRALPALFGFLLLPALYWVGAALFGRRAGLLAALAAAVSVFHARFSQEVRMYTLLPLLGLLSLYFLYKAVLENKIRYWIGYGLLMTATLYTHNYGAFIAAAGVVFFIIIALGQKLNWVKFLIVNGLVGLAFLPWLPVVLGRQLGNPSLVGWIPRMRLVHVFQTFGSYVGLPIHLFRPGLNTAILIVGAAAFLVCFAAGIFTLRMRGRLTVPYIPNQAGLVLVLCYLVVTLGLPMLISVWKPILLPFRYSIAAWPAFVLLLGNGLAKFKKTGVRLTILALVLAVSSASLYWYHFRWVKSHDREIAAFIESNAGPKDVIVYAPDVIDLPIKYYLRFPRKSVGYVPRENAPEKTLAQAKAMMKPPRSRLFLVCDTAMTWVPQLNELQRLFDVSFQRVKRKDFYPMRITVYARKRSDAL